MNHPPRTDNIRKCILLCVQTEGCRSFTFWNQLCHMKYRVFDASERGTLINAQSGHAHECTGKFLNKPVKRHYLATRKKNRITLPPHDEIFVSQFINNRAKLIMILSISNQSHVLLEHTNM